MQAFDQRTSATGGELRTAVGLATSVRILSGRSIRAAAREGDFIIAFVSPALFFVCFYTPLHRGFEASGGSYAQYLTPVIALQAGLFTAIAAAETSGADAATAVRDRFAALPIARSAPAVGRLVRVAVRAVISVVGAIVIGAACGFRFRGAAIESLWFVLAAVAFAIVFSLLTDALGSVTTHPRSVAQVLLIPQLLLVMISTGIVPAERFPAWIRPFAADQPVSVFSDALRGWTSGSGAAAGPVLAWTAGLGVVGAAAIIAAGWRRGNQ